MDALLITVGFIVGSLLVLVGYVVGVRQSASIIRKHLEQE